MMFRTTHLFGYHRLEGETDKQLSFEPLAAETPTKRQTANV